MHRAAYVAVACCACLVAGVVPEPAPAAEPEIVELYPNPAAPHDSGEFITVRAPAGTNLSAYQLADEQATVSLSQPSSLSSGTSFVTFSTDTERTSSLTGRTVNNLPDGIQLANGGERVRLLRDGKVVDEVEYEQAPEAELYDVEDRSWSPLGRTEQPVVTHTGGTVETFVLPDESERAITFLENASNRILLSAYTVSSDTVVKALIDAHERGVAVEVLAEGSPVGGMSTSSAAALDKLSRAGVTVRVFTDEMARFRFHHAKYAVVDRRALVTTENWKASGVGGGSSRGWGVVTAQDRIVEGLVKTFRSDSGWVDTEPWSEYDDISLVDGDTTRRSFPKNFEAETLPVASTRLLLAPDNAEGAVRETIEGAEESIDIKQMQIGSRGFPLLRAVLNAAERGVEVRILLSGAWYVEEENRQLKRWLDEQADAEGLPLSVRIAEPDGTFEKIHAKGLIVDGEHTFVGSINWNNNSLRHNREVGLMLESQAVGAYFETVFESDWGDTSDRKEIPLGYVAACLVGALAAVVAGHRIQFED